MANKATKKMVISGAFIKDKLATMEAGEEKLICKIAGVCERVKVKHTEVGSGLVFTGDFMSSSESGEHSAAVLVLPVDMGDMIARKVIKEKTKVRFAGNISIKKSDLLSAGYSLHMGWTVKPEKIGQLDLVRDMLKNGDEELQTHSFD